MKEKTKVGIHNNISNPAKKTWVKPGVEIISQDNVQSGQVGNYQESTFIPSGNHPFSQYHS
jgi:hypothetical protein